MSLRDRPYGHPDGDESDGRSGWAGGNVRLALPRPTRVTMILIAVCTFMFFLQKFTEKYESPIEYYLTLQTFKAYEVWRFITFQFLHASVSHFMWNMVGLYFFCGPLERLWSGRKFLLFYLACGVGGGLGFVLLTSILFAFGYDSALLIPLLGASGGILGCLMACAILFPEMLFLIFPIRWVTAFIFALYLLTVIFEKHLGNACHLGGMITAAVWVWGVPKIRQSSGMRRPRRVRGPWQHKLDQRDRDREEVDRILQKVHEQGIQSLTGKERKKLQQETDKYKKRNSDLP